MAAEIEAEICVIGGGPAGAVTAMRLAQLGRRVCLLERAMFPRPHIGESLPSSIWPILRFLGVDDAMKAGGFLQSSGSVLMWAGRLKGGANQSTIRAFWWIAASLMPSCWTLHANRVFVCCNPHAPIDHGAPGPVGRFRS